MEKWDFFKNLKNWHFHKNLNKIFSFKYFFTKFFLQNMNRLLIWKMSKNIIFAQKLIKLLACQTCQNKKKHPVLLQPKLSTTYEQRLRRALILGPIFIFQNFLNIKLPMSNNHLSTKATNFGSQLNSHLEYYLEMLRIAVNKS